MPATVCDASLLGAIVFEEPEAGRAEALLDDHELHVPALLGYELATIARTKERRGERPRDDLLGALARGLALELQWHHVSPLAIFELASSTGLTAYDAAYLHLAIALGLPLATFDRTLQSAAAGRVPLL